MAYDASYTTCRRYKGKKGKKSVHTENCQNFYTRRPNMGRSEGEMWRNGQSDYGVRPHGPVGMLPIPITGMIKF